MQGDIFYLDQLATPAQVVTSVPVPASSSHSYGNKSAAVSLNPDQDTSTPAIYNEDDLSHLLYVHSHLPHTHTHHSHHNYALVHPHPADEQGKVPLNDLACPPFTSPFSPLSMSSSDEPPSLSDCDGESDDESITTPQPQPQPQPLVLNLPSTDEMEAYHAKGRRNAFAFEDGFEFPVFLGRQAEYEEEEAFEFAVADVPELVASAAKPRDACVLVTEVEIVSEVRHVDAIAGAAMSWWPAPVDVEVVGMGFELEKERAAEVKPVDDISGPMMSWWPEVSGMMLHQWDERFYE